MTTNPWQINAPFKPMFSESVKFSTDSGEVTVGACVFPVVEQDPFEEQSLDSAVRRVELLMMGDDAAQVEGLVKIGGVFALEDNSKWAIAQIDHELEWLKILARNVED